jgi:hypothetical protein
MSMTSNFTEEQLAGIERVKKLMAMADHPNTNENEAANAAAMASDILTRLNLNMEDAQNSEGKGERSDQKILGGFYQHERDLWEALAELNFCYYYTVKVRYDEEKAKKERRKYAHHHRLIGRTVNIVGTQVMAEYLLSTLERLVKQYCTEERPYEKYHPRSETAVSFRKGAAARLIERINERRRELILEEARKAREAKVQATHPSAAPTSNALVVNVTSLTRSEMAANYDFKAGRVGAWDEMREYEERERKAAAEHERRYANDPKYKRDYDREQERLNKRWERQWRSESNKAYDRMGDVSAYRAGERRADTISLDKQIGGSETGKLK